MSGVEPQKLIAMNTKEIRERKKLTLDAAAKLTGVSRSMLAQIEKGDANPTVSVLWKLANGYKVSFTSLVDNHAEPELLIRAGDIPPLREDGGKYINYPAFPFQGERPFETYRIEIRPGGFLSARPHLAGAEEYVTVFAGKAEICAGGEAFLLNEGDSLRFRADSEHSYRNAGEGTVWMSMIIFYAK